MTEPPLEDQLTALILEVEEVAKKLNRPVPEVLTFLMHRELMITNRQLTVIHDLIFRVCMDKEEEEKGGD